MEILRLWPSWRLYCAASRDDCHKMQKLKILINILCLCETFSLFCFSLGAHERTSPKAWKTQKRSKLAFLMVHVDFYGFPTSRNFGRLFLHFLQQVQSTTYAIRILNISAELSPVRKKETRGRSKLLTVQWLMLYLLCWVALSRAKLFFFCCCSSEKRMRIDEKVKKNANFYMPIN